MGAAYILPGISPLNADNAKVNGLFVASYISNGRIINVYLATGSSVTAYLAGYGGGGALSIYTAIPSSGNPQFGRFFYDATNQTWADTGIYALTGGQLIHTTVIVNTSNPPYSSNFTWNIRPYDTQQEADDAVMRGETGAPINYNLRNCSAPGAPERADPGAQGSITLTANSGFEFLDPASDIYVTNNGVAVVSSYANGVLHFTMP